MYTSIYTKRERERERGHTALYTMTKSTKARAGKKTSKRKKSPVPAWASAAKKVPKVSASNGENTSNEATSSDVEESNAALSIADKAKYMNLHVILRENHKGNIADLQFHSVHDNVFATVGGNQASIYDNQHLGNHCDIMCNYVNETSEHVKGGALTTCCWVSLKGLKDACLAVAGDSGEIVVISHVRSCAEFLLKGHTSSVTVLAPVRTRPGLLLSRSDDGTIRLWDIVTESCVREYQSEVGGKENCFTSLAVLPDGKHFFASDGRGFVYALAIPSEKELRPEAKKVESAPTFQGKFSSKEIPFSKASVVFDPFCDSTLKKQKRFNQLVIPGGANEEAYTGDLFLLGKTEKGNVTKWKVTSKKKGKSSKIAPYALDQVTSLLIEDECGLCKMSVSKDGNFVCGGDDEGSIFVKDVGTGETLGDYYYKRVKGQGLSVTFSPCENFILYTNSNTILRYDFWSDQKEAYEKKQSEGANAELENA